MINIKNKKISLSALLILIVLIIFVSILKEKGIEKIIEYDDYGTYIGYRTEDVIRFLNIRLYYNNTLFYLFIAVILSVVSLIFLDDDFFAKKTVELKRRFSSIKEYKQNISSIGVSYILESSANRYRVSFVILVVAFFFFLIAKCSM